MNTKLEILDAPFRDSFLEMLKKDEQIIKEIAPLSEHRFFPANPFQNANGYEEHIFWTVIFITSVAIWFYPKFLVLGILIISVMLFFKFVIPEWHQWITSNTLYALTDHRILFQFKKRWQTKSRFHSIEYSDLKGVIVNLKYDIERLKKDYEELEMEFPDYLYPEHQRKSGTLFLVPKYPDQISFETKDLTNNQKRHLPTLEMVSEVEEIAKLIQQKISR